MVPPFKILLINLLLLNTMEVVACQGELDPLNLSLPTQTGLNWVGMARAVGH